ncbi:putative plasmid replication-associated protein [Staphylococcus agnetis]|uniref:plasmid replication-associated protein n=1 Tax=Staphylococcus agnetis TaxID=985762 RepID=UPI000DFA622E|nr:plasmid replication-associated protein [Staphylococcus agnetis]SUJ98553.1 putative plasmid replication-associated protein [Staphylococcus agnetis]
MAGFLDNIDTSEVKYTENYKPVPKSTTMRVDTDIKKRLNQMALDRDTSIKSIVDEVLEDFLVKNNY